MVMLFHFIVILFFFLLIDDAFVSRVDNHPTPITMYEYGGGDLYNMIFYSLIWIIIHAVIHEYIWEVRDCFDITRIKLRVQYNSQTF